MKSGNVQALPNLQEAIVSEQNIVFNPLINHDRIGKFTCSEFHRLITYENNLDDLPKGAEKYVLEKVAESLTNNSSFNDDFISDSIQWGKNTEALAVNRFQEETGIAVKNIGDDQQFIMYDGKNELLKGHVGGTPDGIIDDEVGLEIKCPDSKTHISYLLSVRPETAKKEIKNYYWQMQGCMMLTEKKAWYFMSFDPRFKEKKDQSLIIRIDRDEEDIDKLLVRLEMSVIRKKEILEATKRKRAMKC